jgi:serine/threonine protein kinase
VTPPVTKPTLTDHDVPWPLLHVLRQSHLLTEVQLDQVEQQAPTLDLPALEALLLQNGWLTPYQWARVRNGQAHGLALGQYLVLEELGQGSFGKVYKAVHRLMDRVAAVKVLEPRRSEIRDQRDLLVREVLANSRLVHPNIALVYEADQTDDLLWFAMEYVDGPNLEAYVAKKGILPIPLACHIMRQAAQALQHAHEKGMVHRDIKPANLLLLGARSWTAPPAVHAAAPPVLVKVVDFGLAKLISGKSGQLSSICQSGEFVGTPLFVSPEQASDSHEVDVRSDLYSLGCTFYYALAGRPPFQGSSTLTTIFMHLESKAEPVQRFRAGVPSEVANIVSRLMEKDPARRFQTPAELAEALTIALENLDRGRRSSPSDGPRSTTAVIVEEEPAPPQPVSPEPEAHEPAPSDAGSAATTPTAETAPCPPSAPPQGPILDLWREWFRIVDALARGARPGWNEQEYALLYEGLRAGLRERSDPPSDPRSQLYARLESIVEPWLTLHALAGFDRKSLRGLAEVCRRLDAEMSPCVRLPYVVWVLLVGLVLGVALLAAWLFLNGRW